MPADDLASVIISTLPAQGALRLNGTPIVAGDLPVTVTAVQIAAGELTFLAEPDENGSNYANFEFQVRDDGGTANGGIDTDPSTNVITIDVAADVINGTPMDDDLVGTPGPDIMNGLGANDRMRGLGDDDVMNGNDGLDYLYGGDGDDQLNGGADKDYLDGEAGTDTLTGGTGDDRYFVESGDTIVEADGEGLDIVYARTSFVLAAGVSVELLAAVDATATDIIHLTGNEFNNVIQGNAGRQPPARRRRRATIWSASAGSTCSTARPATTYWSAAAATTATSSTPATG